MTEAAWYLIQSKPRRERAALDNLERQGYTVFLPMLRTRRRIRGRTVRRIEPMFPRYLFVRLKPETDNFAPIRSTYGVAQIVRFGEEYARVPEPLVAELRSRGGRDGICDEPEAEIVGGDAVLVVDGTLAGYEAVFVARKRKDRVALLLEIAGRYLEVETSRESIKPLK